MSHCAIASVQRLYFLASTPTYHGVRQFASSIQNFLFDCTPNIKTLALNDVRLGTPWYWCVPWSTPDLQTSISTFLYDQIPVRVISCTNVESWQKCWTRTCKLAYVDKHSTLNICHAGKFDKHNKFSTFVHFWPAIHVSRHVDVTPSFT
jgi:hypothetical protein